MNNPEFIHSVTQEERERVMRLLGGVIVVAVAQDIVAYPEIIGRGPTPLVGGLLRGGEPCSANQKLMNTRVYHEGTPAGPAYSVRLTGVGERGLSQLVQIDAGRAFSVTPDAEKSPLEPMGYALLEAMLSHTAFTKQETNRAVSELKAEGALADQLRGPKPSIRQLLYNGLWYAATAMYPELSGFVELTDDKEQERRTHDGDE
jgi:hypothetical protein